MKKDAPWYIRHRQRLGQLIPFIIVHAVWWPLMSTNDWWYKFDELVGKDHKPRWYLTITMIFGSMIAGATSEGGGSVAFPVMTLLLGINPSVARDFSFMTQCIGMIAAAFTITVMRVQVELRSYIPCTLGGIAGVIFGLEQISMEPAYSKIYFVTIWLTFAFSLYTLNSLHGRAVYEQIPDWEGGVLLQHPRFKWLAINWKWCVLLACGFLGGIFSSIAGVGLDITVFAFLCLFFRVSEKVATPTSVVVMAVNTVVGFLYREYGQGGVKDGAWDFLIVVAPIVVIGAPLGTVVGSYLHRLTLAFVVYLLDIVQFIIALYVIRPWMSKAHGGKTATPTHLCWSSGLLLVGGFIFFEIVAKLGMRLSTSIEARLAAGEKIDAILETKSVVLTIKGDKHAGATVVAEEDSAGGSSNNGGEEHA